MTTIAPIGLIETFINPTTNSRNFLTNAFSLMGVRSLLFVTFFLVATIPIAILSLWVERTAVEKEISAVNEKHLIVAQNLSGALSRYVTDITLVFNLYSEEDNLPVNNTDINNSLNSLHLDYIAIVDQTGTVISNTHNNSTRPPPLPEMNLLDQLRETANKQVGEVVFSGITKFRNKPYFFVLKMLSSGNLVFAPLNPTYVVKVQKAISFGERGHSMIVDHLGRVVAHPNAQWQASSKNASKLSVVQKMIAGESGVTQFYSPPMKADMIAGYTFVPETGWGVMVPQPMSELIDRAHDVQSVALLIAALEILLVGLLSWWLSCMLSKPVLAVVKAARKVSEGNLDVEVGNISGYLPSEMRVLSTTFDDMVIDLRAKTNQLSGALLKAEEGSRTKSQFLAMMSHEIRTPMNGVLGVLELLDDTALDEEQQHLISVAQNSGNSLIQVINDILDFSKLEAGKLELLTTPSDIRNTIVEVIQLFRPITDQKPISLDYHVSDSTPDLINIDAQRVRQVLFNLLGNAVKFTEIGGVMVRTDFSTEDSGNNILRIIVSDSGIGIPQKMHSRLFEDFAQCDASYSRKYGGTGLGLAISMRLIKMMGGTIGFDSVSGKGSSFWVSIPVEVGPS